jgi:hypothetical protein
MSEIVLAKASGGEVLKRIVSRHGKGLIYSPIMAESN